MIKENTLKKLILTVFITVLMVACKQVKGTEDIPLVKDGMIALDRALITKDTLILNQLLHKDLSLGHSNGWIETKAALPETLLNNGVVYKSIEMPETPEVTHQSDNLITTRRNLDVDGVVNETPFSVKLNVLEVWIRENDNWQLLARQSVNRRE